jgi:hypothetical protein
MSSWSVGPSAGWKAAFPGAARARADRASAALGIASGKAPHRLQAAFTPLLTQLATLAHPERLEGRAPGRSSPQENSNWGLQAGPYLR